MIKKIGTPVSIAEAYAIINNGTGFVTSGGYTLFKGGYFAEGTFPGCMRTGKNAESLEMFELFCLQTRCLEWYHLTVRDVILKTGYYPDGMAIIDHLAARDIKEVPGTVDYSIERTLVARMIDSPYKVAEFQSTLSGPTLMAKLLDVPVTSQGEPIEVKWVWHYYPHGGWETKAGESIGLPAIFNAVSGDTPIVVTQDTVQTAAGHGEPGMTGSKPCYRNRYTLEVVDIAVGDFIAVTV